ncbi:MAG: DUF1127 domain-containing protein [Pelagimonas sp.]|nr:DUF1127 domain-containing protein [Pelagimonas sp.]
MAAFDTTRPYAAAGSASKIGSFLAALVSVIADWNDTRATRKSLTALSDRELSDIGLTRGDIDSVVARL